MNARQNRTECNHKRHQFISSREFPASSNTVVLFSRGWLYSARLQCHRDDALLTDRITPLFFASPSVSHKHNNERHEKVDVRQTEGVQDGNGISAGNHN